jgi:hypothetical protein
VLANQPAQQQLLFALQLTQVAAAMQLDSGDGGRGALSVLCWSKAWTTAHAPHRQTAADLQAAQAEQARAQQQVRSRPFNHVQKP